MQLIPLIYCYCDIFTYMFRLVIRPSSVWHFCYKNTVWPNVSNYSYTCISIMRGNLTHLVTLSHCILLTDMSPWRWPWSPAETC